MSAPVPPPAVTPPAPAASLPAPGVPNRRIGIALLLGVTLGWGLNWPALKIVVSEVPIWQFRAVTGFAAALLLLFIAFLLAHPMRVPRRQLPALLVASLFNVSSWFLLIAYGADMLKAAHASILAFTMPVFAAVFGVLFVGERMSVSRIVAVLLTIGTVGVLLSHDFDVLEASPWGVLVTLIGASNWAIGVLVLKHTPWRISPLPLAGWQLLIGSVPIAIVAWLTEDFVYHEASDLVMWSSVYLVLVALVFCYAGWFTVVRIFPASVASISVLLVPIIGAASSALILEEPFGWREIAALGMVVTAIGLVFFFDGRAVADRGTADRQAEVPAEKRLVE